jgi:predicted transcriptional regulator
MAKVTSTFRLDEELLKTLDELAENMGENRSELIERLLLDALPTEQLFQRLVAIPGVARALAATFGRDATIKAFATILGDNLTEKDVKRIKDNGPKIIEAGKRIREKRRPQNGVEPVRG